MLNYYFAFFVAIALTCLFSVRSVQKGFCTVKVRKASSFAIASLPIALVFLLRWGVGIDANWYVGTYPQIYRLLLNDPTQPYETDPLFSLLTKLFCYLKIPYFWWVFFLGLIYIVAFFNLVYRCSSNTPISVFLFLTTDLFFFAFGALKQALAISFLLIAYCELLNKRERRINWRIVLMFILSFMAHSSALLYVICFCFSLVRLSKAFLIKITIGTVVLCPFTIFGLSKIIEKTEYGREFIGTQYGENQGSLTHMVFSFVLLVLLIVFYERILEFDEMNCFWVNMTFCYFVLMINSPALIQTFRIVYYFMPTVIIVIPLLISVIRKRALRVVSVLGVILVSVFIFWNTYYNNDGKFSYENYQTIFSYTEFLS